MNASPDRFPTRRPMGNKPAVLSDTSGPHPSSRTVIVCPEHGFADCALTKAVALAESPIATIIRHPSTPPTRSLPKFERRRGRMDQPTVALLRQQTVAALPDVMAALGPRVSRLTAFRKLKDLHARTSYSPARRLLHPRRSRRLRRTRPVGVRRRPLLPRRHPPSSPANSSTAQPTTRRRRISSAPDGCGWPPQDSGGPARRRPDARGGCAPPSCCSPASSTSASAGCSPDSNRFKCGWGGDRRIATLLGIDPSTVATGRRQPRRPRYRGSTGCGARAADEHRRKRHREVIARIDALMTHRRP